jgi:iron-sulfur cluster assembly protein
MHDYTFTLSPKAVEKAKEGLVKRNTPESALRIGVRGGLCSGFAYHLAFCDDEPKERDLVFEFDGLKVYIDKKSIIYLNGTELSWENTLMTQGFKFNNPNVKSSCGCDKSFSV